LCVLCGKKKSAQRDLYSSVVIIQKAKTAETPRRGEKDNNAAPLRLCGDSYLFSVFSVPSLRPLW
ncbi:MAG: hypothetical protein WC271_11010, partial [Bacteroidales bacterium]